MAGLLCGWLNGEVRLSRSLGECSRAIKPAAGEGSPRDESRCCAPEPGGLMRSALRSGGWRPSGGCQAPQTLRRCDGRVDRVDIYTYIHTYIHEYI